MTFPQPATALDSQFKEQASSLLQEIRIIHSQGIKTESADIPANCLKLMAFDRDKVKPLEQKIGAFADPISADEDSPEGLIQLHFDVIASNLALCYSCSRKSCDSVNDSVNAIQEILDPL